MALAKWASSDPERALAAFAALPPGKERQQCLNVMAYSMAARDSAAALAWAGQLDNAQEKSSAMKAILGNLSHTDPIKALAVLEQNPAANSDLWRECVYLDFRQSGTVGFQPRQGGSPETQSPGQPYQGAGRAGQHRQAESRRRVARTRCHPAERRKPKRSIWGNTGAIPRIPPRSPPGSRKSRKARCASRRNSGRSIPWLTRIPKPPPNNSPPSSRRC